MTTEVMTVKQLSGCSEADFDKHIREMSLKTLMESISGLQKEMGKEQENFNSLNGQLQTMKSRNSSQYKSISKDMVASQSRLTLLMNRSMKCFAQQNLQQGKEQSGSVQLRRRNSAKGDQPSPTKSSTNVQRSKSMYIPPQPDPDPPTTRIIKAGSSAFINHSTIASKPYTPVIANGILMTRTPTGGKIPGAEKVKTQVQMVNVMNKTKIPNDTANKENSVTNGEKGDFQVLPSVKQLAKSFGSFQKSNDTNVVPNNKPKLVKLRSSESMRIERPVSDGLVFSSKQKDGSVVNGNSGQTSSGRHVVSTVLKFDPSPRYKSTENLFSSSFEPVRARTNSIPREINVSSSTRESTPVRIDPTTPTSTKVVISSKGQNSNSENQTRTRINVKQSENGIVPNSANSKKIEYNMFSGKDALMQEIASRRKDSDAETTKIEVNEKVLKSKQESHVPVTSSVHVTSSVTPATTATTKVFVSGDNSAKKEGVKTEEKGPPSYEDTVQSQPPVVRRNGGSSAPEKPARKSRPDSQNLVDQGRQPTLGTVDHPDGMTPTPLVNAPVKTSETPHANAPAKTSDTTKAASPVRRAKDGDEVVEARFNLKAWDPRKVLQELYTIKLMEDNAEDISHQYIAMEGYMEKLPMNKKKSTLLKTWKRRFFKALNGWLYYYESSNLSKPSDTVQLMGGNVDDMGNRILGIDDGRGKFLMVRCPTEREHGQWKLALESQLADNTKAVYIRPVLRANPHPQKKVVIIDLGSSSVRAGLLGDQASLPTLFFPSVVAVNKTTDEIVVGIDAYKPTVRHQSTISHPISPSNKVDKDHNVQPFNIDNKQMPAVFDKVFRDLGVNPSQYLVMLSTPQSLGDNLKKSLMELLVERFQVAGVCMVQQALLSLYSYNATSGIIVDIGQRIEILAIFDGVLIEGGMARLPYGSQKIQDTLQLSLLANNYTFSSEVEQTMVRYIMEKSCYVAQNYKLELEKCAKTPQSVRTNIKLDHVDLPPGAYPSVSHDDSRFRSPEGLFDTDMWEMDFPNLHKLVYQAIQTCPMDSRRRMFRAVYLSGGVSMIPGFVERLENELVKLAPPSVPVEVHAAPQRYHAAYVGACAVARMSEFEHMCISRDEWHSQGTKALRKWNAPSS